MSRSLVRSVHGAVAVALIAGAACATPPSPSPEVPHSASASAPSDAACPVAEQHGRLRSDHLADAEVTTIGSADLLTLRFEPASRPDIISAGRLRAVEPPFVQGESGEPLELAGTHFVEVRLDGMLIHDELGLPYFKGERSIVSDLPALRQVELVEAFEAIIVFVIGYHGTGCVRLIDDAAEGALVITIGH